MMQVQRMPRSPAKATPVTSRGNKRDRAGGGRDRTRKPRRDQTDPIIKGTTINQNTPLAMAWGSGHHTLVAGSMVGGNKVMASGDNIAVSLAMPRALVQGGGSTPSITKDHSHNHNLLLRREGQLVQQCRRLPDSVLYQPYSHQPLATVDLSIWQDQLSSTMVEDVRHRNATFSKLVLRRARRGSEMLALITGHFGHVITQVDISDSSVVDARWLTALAAECPTITQITAARCCRITDRGVEILAKKKGVFLRALSVAGCREVSDDGVEFLTKYCTGLRCLDLRGCPRVRDRSVYALGALKGLEEIALDGCAEVSDGAVRHMFTNVTRLKSLSIKGCTNITEEGLRFMNEMPVPWGTRKHNNCAQLEAFHVGYNNYISDEFIMSLPVICPHLHILEVVECPLVGGDDAMGKVGGLLELVDVTLESLPRVSDQGVRQLFCDLPRRSLENLSLAGCMKVTDVSLKLIAKNARGLRQLRLDRSVSVTDRGLNYLTKGLTRLTVLQATHLGMISDEGVRLIARRCLKLTELDVSHCLGLTPACLPALRRLRRLEFLGLTNCQGLFTPVKFRNNCAEDGSVTGPRGGRMPKTTITALDSAEFRNLRCLRLAQLPSLTDEAVRSVAERNGRTLTSLDISQCSGITVEGVTLALKALTVLKRLDVTNCEHIKAGFGVESLARCVSARLLLSCARHELDGFDGLHCSAGAEDARSQSEVVATERREVLGAGTVQRAFRRYRQREKENEEATRTQDRLTLAAMTIQASVLRYIARCRLHERAMRRARLLLHVFKWRRRTQESRAWSLASRHGGRTLLLRLVRDWRAAVVEEMVEASDLAERGEVFFENVLVKTHLKAWVRFMGPPRARWAIEDGKADEWWRSRTRENLFRRWRDNTRKIITRRKKMVELLLFVLPLGYRNSARQKPKVESAVTFHRRRALRKAWKAFINLNVELADLRQRFKQFDEANRPRVLRRNFLRLRAGVELRIWNRGAKQKANAVAALSIRRRMFRKLRAATASAVASRLCKTRADAFANRTLTVMGWEVLREHPAENKIIKGLIRLWEERAASHRDKVVKTNCVRLLEEQMRRRLRLKVLTASMMAKYTTTTMRTCFMAWKLHHRTLKNAADPFQARDRTEILASVFAAWIEISANAGAAPKNVGAYDETEPVSERKTKSAALQDEAPVEALLDHIPEASSIYVAQAGDDTRTREPQASDLQQYNATLPVKGSIESAVKSRGGHDGDTETAIEETPVVVVEVPPEFSPAATVIQAAWRGFSARKIYEEIRVTRQWAAVKLQSAFRGRKAARVFSKRMRYKHIRDMVKAEGEMDAMAIDDRDSRRLRDYHQALSTVGRIILGYKGRKIAKERRREARLEEASKRYAIREEAVRRHEETQKRLEALRKSKEKSATLIQAFLRSVMARVRVRGIREDNRRNAAATRIQCGVRFRAARHDAAARNRQLERTAYIHLERHHQARFLRLAGLRHRRLQRPAIRFLRRAGADLMGFTTSLRVQKRDLEQGIRLAWQEYDMNKEAVRVGGRDAYRRHNMLRSRQLDDLERKRVRRGDAVKILEREHEFCGFTGRVLHVDGRDPCREVAEVKLDDGTGRVVHVRLLTHVDGKHAIPYVNMLKIARKEIPQHKPEELALLKDALLAWADRERSWWRPHLAAVAIQKQIRGYLARRATARRRYHYWTRERAVRLTFLRSLDVANAATYQAVRAAVMLRVVRASMVPTNMPWVPPLPPRLEEANKQRRHRIILGQEIRSRVAERALLVAKDPRKLQWKTTTHGPLIRGHHPSKEAWSRMVSRVVHPSALPGIFRSLAGPSTVESLHVKAHARAVFTRSFHFTQLQHSPHVRTAGRALFHGAWARPDPPPSETSSDSETDPGKDRWNTAEYNDGDDENDQDTTEGRETAVDDDDGTERENCRNIREAGESQKRRGMAWSWQKVARGSGGAGGIGGGDGNRGGKMIKRQQNEEKKSKKRKKNPKNRRKMGKMESRPHGEGYVEFLDGWGVSQEEKTLYVTVVGAQDLPSVDRSLLVSHCDPFFQLKCNGQTSNTSTKHDTREPKYNETFEFDVTNPSSVLTLECWEEDTFSNSYIGVVTLPLRELANGEKVRNSFPLGAGVTRKEAKKGALKGKSRGSVEVVLQWLPKATEDDVSIRIRLSKAAVVLQCWARAIVARRVVKEAAAEVTLKADFAFTMTRRIQMCWRRYSSKEQLRVRRMHYRNACIVQKFARRKLAFMELAWRKLVKEKATAIQCFSRQRLSRNALARLREARRILERDMATKIQANARGKLAHLHVAAKRKLMEEKAIEHHEGQPTPEEEPIPVSQWLETYGADPYYPSRRIRRITEKAYYKILGTTDAVVETRFGTSRVVKYPAKACLSRRRQDKGTALRAAKCFIEVNWNAHADLHWPRKQRETVFEEAPRCYRGFLELDSVPADRTVARRAIVIQCLVRIWLARRRFERRNHFWGAAIVIQRAYRQYSNTRSSALRLLQNQTRRHLAKRSGERLTREKRCVVAVQCAYRSRKARLVAAYKRVIRTVKVSGSSGCSDPSYGAENTVVLDPADEATLWSSPYGETTAQWITFDLGSDCPVGALRLLAMSNTTCPKLLRVECCKTKKQAKAGIWTLAGSFRVDKLAAWQQFELPRRLDGTGISRRWKVTFVSNHGNTTATALNGVQFLLAKEESPRVLSQSQSTVVTPPPVGKDPGILELSVEGTAWPPHGYQWYRNGRLLEGETLATVGISLTTPPSMECRPFRCIHCKHAAQAVPRNAPRVICGNCEAPFVFKEYEETCAARSAWEKDIDILEATVKAAAAANEKAIVDRDKAYLEEFLCEDEGREKALAAKLDLEGKKAVLADADKQLNAAREAVNDKHRELLKTTRNDPLKIRHDFEGLYECRLSNIRGGNIVRTVSSYGIYVFARDPPPLRLKVRVEYVPRDKLRRRYWPKYAWAFGWFVHGQIGGEILIKYHDGAVYDGPYVSEACLDLKGTVPTEAREPGHWGTWITKIGWTYEGPSVDNHFDKDCISGVYRLTTPGGEVYDGDMVDEEKHGVGEYRYADGTVYTGEWHRGQRQGFGTLTSPDGAIYEGEFDHDVIHGEGRWTWPDGSSYAGQSKHGYREGKGLYVTDMRDGFYGNFYRNKPHGEGFVRYCDGSSYTGEFYEGARHGQGTLQDENGVRIIGTFARDKRNGEFELRTPVYIPELGESQDEIRTGLWEAGEFVEWLSPPVYPYATKQFYEMFEEDDSQYDGVYAMLVAKKLPILPRGVDPNNPRVVACVHRIAAEAGELCAADTIADAEEQITAAQKPYDATVSRLQSTQALERVGQHEHEKKKEAADALQGRLAALVTNRDKLEAEVEQFYHDDPDKTREQFHSAVQRLKTVDGAEWFIVRNYDQPPPVLAALMSAVCTLMLARDSWKSARNLIGSSVQNMEDSSEQDALAHITYDCKLVYRLENEFSPYTRCDATDVMMKLATFVVDPRFSGESLFLKLYGDALGPLAETVKTAYAYIVKAAHIKPKKLAIAGVEGNIKYTSKCLEQEREEEAALLQQVQERVAKREEAEVAEAKALARLEKAKALLAEASALVTVYVAPRGELDPYEQLEADLDPDLTEVEVVLELLAKKVEDRLKTTPTEVPKFEVVEFIYTQTAQHAAATIADGAYTFTAGTEHCVDDPKIASVKAGITDRCKRGVNACLHDNPPLRGTWKSLQGQKLNELSLQILMEHRWRELISKEALRVAVHNWTKAFPEEGEAAYRALLSVSNKTLSEERKAEAQLWLDNNVDEVKDMVWNLAMQFEGGWPENTAEGCVQVLDGNDYGPDVRLQAASWGKNNADAVRQYRAEVLERMASEFAVMWESEEEAARQVIAIRERQDDFQGVYAEAWASFHLSEMVKAEASRAKERADAFEDRFPDGTATSAVKIAAAQGGNAPVSDTEEALEALAWCSSHARAAVVAEAELVVDVAARDAEIAVEQDVFERRLERLHANAVLGNPDGEENEITDGIVEVNEDEQTPQTGKQGTRIGGASRSPKEDRQARGGREPSPREAKEKKKSPTVKKSKAQQFAEKQELERIAKEEEENRRREAEAEEEALRSKPKSKVEEITGLLAGKLAERLELCCELLLLLRRSQQKAREDDSPEKALNDPHIRPSEREVKHNILLEDRRKMVDGIAARIADVEAKAEEIRSKLEVNGGGVDNNAELLAAQRAQEGWASYLDEQSGQYYWFNEYTGEAYYDEGGG